jgi:hypothetical protein
MLEKKYEIKKLITAVIIMLENLNYKTISDLLRFASINAEATGYDNWNGGIDYYTVYINVSLPVFVSIEDKIVDYEKIILDRLQFLTRDEQQERIVEVLIKPIMRNVIDWNLVFDRISKCELLTEIESLKSIMICVATGKEKIDVINNDYKSKYQIVNEILEILDLENPNNFRDLWQWYSRWSGGDLPSYKSRRNYISELYEELINIIENSEEHQTINQPYEITGWNRIDRSILEMRKRIEEAVNEEQFQAIGLLSRETIISLAQQVFDKEKHKTTDEIKLSETDANRMLEAYINTELAGGTNEVLRRYTKSALALANYVTHKRTASIDDASICLISVISLVNIIKVVDNESIMRF